MGTHRRDVEAEAHALKCLDLFMDTWNARDGVAHAAAFNFPSYRIAGHPPTMTVITKDVFKRAYIDQPVFDMLEKRDGWHHSSWDRRLVLWSEPDRVHFDTCFTRYRSDGSIIGVYESIYIVAKNSSGKWGVVLRSSSAD